MIHHQCSHITLLAQQWSGHSINPSPLMPSGFLPTPPSLPPPFAIRVGEASMAGRGVLRIGDRQPTSSSGSATASTSSAAQALVVRPEGVMLDWRASIRALRRAFYSVLLIGRLLQLPRLHRAGNSSIGAEDNNPASAAAAAAAAAATQQDGNSLSRFFFWAHKEDDAAVRRALARQHSRLSHHSSAGAGITMWQEGLFVNSRGQTLFTQSWSPAHDHGIKGLVLLLHGLNEHSGRYARFAGKLNLEGYTVVGMDWMGHGGSDGLHGYVESLDHAVWDTEEFLLKLSHDYPSVPIFLFGHSTGGAIVLKAALQAKLDNVLAGMVLTSPALRVQPTHPVVSVMAPLFSVLLPTYQLRFANRRGLPVTRDPVEQVAKYADPLVYTGPIRIRTGTEILKITAYLQRNLENVSTPFFVLHGTDDKITDPEASRSLFELACTQHKKLKLYEGLLHDLLFELERDVVTADIIDWLDAVVGKAVN